MSKVTEVTREVEQLNEQEWVEFLDELDGVARRRQRLVTLPENPSGTGRNDVAEWIAKRHLSADTTIREIWHLPENSPTDEIRLVELNGRLAGTGWEIEAVDFALDVNGEHYKLLIADVTSDELEQAKRNLAQLPVGWSLSGAQVWRRGS